jgi:hypothetical protein
VSGLGMMGRCLALGSEEERVLMYGRLGTHARPTGSWAPVRTDTTRQHRGRSGLRFTGVQREVTCVLNGAGAVAGLVSSFLSKPPRYPGA